MSRKPGRIIGGSTPAAKSAQPSEPMKEPHKELHVVHQRSEEIPDIILSDKEDSIEIMDGIDASVSTPSTDSGETKYDEGVTGEAIICPICEDQMVSLLQLNRHLDDEHTLGRSSIPSKSSAKGADASGITAAEDMRSWLKKTGDVRSKLSIALPKKLAKLDLFDSSPMLDSSRDSSSNSLNTLVPEITVTRKHWQRPTSDDICSFDGCQKKLNLKNGIVNCRRCGKLFCHRHSSSFRVKLNANAQYDVKGVWCRCCESCYMNKPYYRDFGEYKDLTTQFKAKRQVHIDEKQFYLNKLEKRIFKLSSTLSMIDKQFKSNEFNSNFLNYRISMKKREVEQSLVQWEDANTVLSCSICSRSYGFALRKHHCRLCGKVVCGSDYTGCSKEVPISLLTSLLEDIPKVNDDSVIRICKNCKDVLFAERNFIKDIKSPLSPLLSKFEMQQNIKKAIMVIMPKFESLLIKLRNDKSKQPLEYASKLRQRLMNSISMFDKMTKEILTLKCATEDEHRLQLAIQTDSINFIRKNMAPLRALPRILKHQEDEDKRMTDAHSPLQSPKKSTLSRGEIKKIKLHREELMVLNEQKFLVEEMIQDCTKHRKFDEISPLKDNLNEINRNIANLQKELGTEGF